VLKLSNKLEGDYVTHFLGWIERLTAQSSNWKYLKIDDTIEGGLMMWWHLQWIVKHKALKWFKAKIAPPKGSLWYVPITKGMVVTSPSWLRWL
jgi:hypothetical protein